MTECEKIKWSNVYSIGNEAIDSEHKRLFELAGEVYSAHKNALDIKKALKELIDYTQTHFSNEEEYMAFIQYPYIDQHIRLHRAIVKDLNRFLKTINDLDRQIVIQKLQFFIKERIVKHILIEDKRMQHFKTDKHELRNFFSWKELYKINNEQIDQEHRQLFSLAIKALNYSQNRRMQTHVKNIIKELYEYMRHHFENEETYMRQIGFEEYDRHKQLHDRIIAQMNDFVTGITRMEPAAMEQKLIEYMDVWLVQHIIIEDRKITCYRRKSS